MILVSTLWRHGGHLDIDRETIHFYILIKFNISRYFCAILSPAPENIFQKETVTILTTTHMQDSHVIVHFYTRQHLHTSLSRSKNRSHQVGPLPPLV